MHRWRLLLAAVPIAGLIAGVSAPASAFAYGNTTAFQLTFSLNCNDASNADCAPPPSGFGYGGEWGWIALDGTSTGGTADVQLTFCNHGGGGAGHLALSDTPWALVYDSPFHLLTTYGITIAGIDPFSMQAGNFLVVPAAQLGVPDQIGHYTLSLAPRVFEQVTVAR